MTLTVSRGGTGVRPTIETTEVMVGMIFVGNGERGPVLGGGRVPVRGVAKASWCCRTARMITETVANDQSRQGEKPRRGQARQQSCRAELHGWGRGGSGHGGVKGLAALGPYGTA